MRLPAELPAPWRQSDAIRELEGLTNRQWLLESAGHKAVLRLANPDHSLGIDRGAEQRAWRWAAGQGISPPLLWQQGDWSLSAHVDGATGPATAQGLDALLGHIRALQGAELALPVLDLPARARLMGAEPGPVAAYGLIAATPMPLVPTHVDLVPENCLWQGRRLWLIDWEYASLADPYYDLAGVLVTHELDRTLLAERWRALTGQRLDLRRLMAMEAIYAHLCELWCLAVHPERAADYRVKWQRRLAALGQAL
ncbi:choline/ethanolamine kinase family protein [Gallaecimonas sp. GXIMD4217]|uniref:choline/ethanolamine kinase family protein n=1 Tax=Gallaecimonas sp. GXIMD4217 TaxID=3131927 RepID=UPI00311AF886